MATASELRERIEAIDTILQTSRHVLTVADDILDMSQLEEGKLETVIEHCPLRSLVQQIEELGEIQPGAVAPAKCFDVSFGYHQKPPQSTSVSCD